MPCNSYFPISTSIIIFLLSVLVFLGNSQCNLYASSGSYKCQTIGSTNTTFSDNNDYCACNSCPAGSSLDTYQISCCLSNFSTNCLTCVGSSSGSCSLCNVGFGFNLTTGVCKTCGTISKCIDCLNVTKCTKCNDYYSLSNGACSLCNAFLSNCQICNSSTTVCFQCDISSYLLPNKTCGQCIVVIPYCLSCSSATTCTTCDLYSALTQSSYCLPCLFFMPYCTQCASSNSSCLSCSADYYSLNITTTPNQCQYCNITLNNCTSCLNSSYCIKCINDSSIFLKFAGSLSNANSAGGFYTVTRYTGIYGTCVSCRSTYAYCERCNSFVCLSCTTDLHIVLVDGKVCQACRMIIDYCSTCYNQTLCLTCINSFYTTVAVNDSSTNCQACSNLMMGCQTCKNSTVCVNCATGVPIYGGCSIVPGCIKVIQKGGGNATCMECNPKQFVPYLINGVCKCLVGHVAGQYCTQIKGCTFIKVVSGQQVCTNCNVSNNMVVINGTCGCLSHFQLNPISLQCEQICGDGLLFQNQCDDGNKISGDGCSSTCEIQNNYVCYGGTPISSSHCVFQQNVSLTLVSITRTQSTNSLVIHFQISPSTMLFSKMNISQSLNFTTSQAIIVNSIQINPPDLFFYIDFTSDVIDEMASIKVIFNQSLIESSPFSLTFPLILTNGEQINYIENLNRVIIYNSIFTYGSILLLVVALFSSFSEKMIAVETLHTFQLILFTQVFSTQYQRFFFIFKKLFLTFGQCNIVFKQQHVQIKILSYLQFSNNFSANYSIISFIVIGLILILAILKLAQKKLHSRQNQSKLHKKKQYNAQINRVEFIARKVYECLLFPLVVGFYYNFVLSSFVSLIYQQFQSKVSSYSSAVIMIASAMYSSIFIIKYFVYFFVPKAKFIDFKKYRVKNFSKASLQPLQYEPLQSYVSIYLLVMIIYGILMPFSVLFLGFKFVYINLGLVLISIIAQLVFRPYRITLHNVGLIYNEACICFSCMWVIYEQYATVSNQIRTVLSSIFISCLSGVIFLAIVRAIYNYRYLYNNRTQDVKQEEQVNLDNINMRLQLIQNQQQQNLIKSIDSTKNIYLQNLRKNCLPISQLMYHQNVRSNKVEEDRSNTNNPILDMQQKNRQSSQASFRNKSIHMINSNSKIGQMKKIYREMFMENRTKLDTAYPQQ